MASAVAFTLRGGELLPSILMVTFVERGGLVSAIPCELSILRVRPDPETKSDRLALCVKTAQPQRESYKTLARDAGVC